MSASSQDLRDLDESHEPESAQSLWRRIDRRDLARLGIVVALALLAEMLSGSGSLLWLVVVLAAGGLAVGCWPIVVEAWEDVRSRRMSMELSMLIAVLAAAVIGQWVTALVITAFVLAAEILEELSLDRGRDALTDLMSFLPRTVQVRTGDTVRSVGLDEVRVGDVVVVRPGGDLPVDGIVAEGRSSLDQSRITGEPLPVDVGPGDTVYAGSVNQAGALAVQTTEVGEGSTYGHIVAAVRDAQESQAPVQRLADRLAGWLVYIALGGALLTYVLTRNLTATISVVIVAGACGVAAGTPLAVLAAIARTARRGAFVKDGTHLEQLSRVDTVVFDKTGTLTRGEPSVAEIRTTPEASPDDVLWAAASAEQLSEHPIGQAIVAHAHDRGLRLVSPVDFENAPGLGVTAHVDGRVVQAGNAAHVPAGAAQDEAPGTAVHVAVDGAYVGTILLADTLRETARDSVAALRRLGLRVVMMTGDREAAALSVGRHLAIDEVHAGLLPAQKTSLVEQLRSQGAVVAMVGDGINDAPALAKANVGIAMGSGTHVARESADIVLISSDLSDLVSTFDTARRARRIVITNFVGTVVVDLVGMLLAGFGLLGPVLAAIVHVGSESGFILNSARLIPRTATRPVGRSTVADAARG